MNPVKTSAAKPYCLRCRGTDLLGPAPMRTSAHPNSSFLMLEAPGARYHDFAVQGTVCLDCGAIDLVLPGPSLERLRETAAGGDGGALRRAAARRKKPR